MPDINLLQSQLKDTTLVSATRTKVAAWVLLIVLLLLIGWAGWLYFESKKIQSKTAMVDAENVKLQTELDGKKPSLKDAQAFQAQLSNINLLLNKHIAFSPLIDELAKDTYQKALYNLVDVAQDTGKIHVSGVADTYEGLGKLILGLSASSHFNSVKLLAVNQAEGAVPGIAFSIEMKATPELFTKKQ